MVGHVEWVEFVHVDHVPSAGEIVHAHDPFCEPAGGGAVAAVQLARLTGGCILYTALGDDDLADRTRARLAQLGVRVEAATRRGHGTRRAFTFVDSAGERTITTIGERLHPSGDDDLPWGDLEGVDAVYFVAGDAGALRRARAARTVVATARVIDVLSEAHVALDAVVGSGSDEAERYRPLDPRPRYVVATAGARGGRWTAAEGRTGSWSGAPLDGPLVDTYGAGDSFAAGLTYALAAGRAIDAALDIAARCGATCATGRGPYGRQLPGSLAG